MDTEAHSGGRSMPFLFCIRDVGVVELTWQFGAFDRGKGEIEEVKCQ